VVDGVDCFQLQVGDAAGGARTEVAFGPRPRRQFFVRFGRGRALAESPERGRKDKAREGAPDDQTSPGSSEFVSRHGGFR
jgi:hypothetical protein